MSRLADKQPAPLYHEVSSPPQLHDLTKHVANQLLGSLSILWSLNAALGVGDSSAHTPSRSLQTVTQGAAMRLSTALPFFNALILVYLLPAISALTLTNFQQISGFNTACTNAYNTPLTDCSTSDFAGQGCSAKCIGFLDDLTTTLLYACSGTSVYPNTLIGLFFHNEGVQTLCSNAGNRTSSSDGG